MGAIRLIQKPVNGQIIFDVPEELRNETIVIEFQPVREPDEKKPLAEVSDSFFSTLKRPTPAPDFDWDSLNPYEQ